MNNINNTSPNGMMANRQGSRINLLSSNINPMTNVRNSYATSLNQSSSSKINKSSKNSKNDYIANILGIRGDERILPNNNTSNNDKNYYIKQSALSNTINSHSEIENEDMKNSIKRVAQEDAKMILARGSLRTSAIIESNNTDSEGFVWMPLPGQKLQRWNPLI